MRKGDLSLVEGCFRCGAIHPETDEIEHLGVKCQGCGEMNSIVTFKLALDFLNDRHVKGEEIVKWLVEQAQEY